MTPRQAAPDSIKANPIALQAITRIVSKKISKPGDTASHWYNHPSYSALFRNVREDKFRKEYNKQMENKYGKDALIQARINNQTGKYSFIIAIVAVLT